MFDRYLRFAAGHVPHAIAAATLSEHVSYRAMDQAVDRIAAALADEGVAPGGLVGVAVRDGYRHVLLLLACARLGVATTSLYLELAAPMARLTGVTRVLSDRAGEFAAPVLLVDQAWFSAVAERAPTPMPRLRLNPAGLARVQLSSGVTGTPKAVDLSWAMLERRVVNSVLTGSGLGRVLSLIGPESGALQLMLSCWRARGTVVFAPDTPAALAATLPALRPSTLLASPVQLAALVDALPADLALIGELAVVITGGKAPRSLRERVARALGANVAVVYASTEAGVSTIGYSARLAHDDAVGFVTASTELEVVGDDDRPLPDGETGRLRIGGPEVAAGYRGEGGSEAFRDGWFYPGDLGRIGADGAVEVLGRIDEVMNLGGEKFLPDALEALVRPVPGVADVAAFALDDGGVAQPWLAVVRDGAVADGAIGRALTLPGLPAVRIAWIDAIPRTIMGKVRREALQEAARQLRAD